MFDLVQGHDQHADVFTSCQMIVRLFISVLQHPGASCGERVLSKFPLQKGRAEVAALTTGRDAVNDQIVL